MSNGTVPPDREGILRAADRVGERLRDQSVSPLRANPDAAAAAQRLDAAADRVGERLRAAEDRALKQATFYALRANPDAAAEAQRLGLEINASPEQIEKDLPRYRQLMQKIELDKWRDAQRDPALRKMMLNPGFARAAHDDTQGLGTLEGLGGIFGTDDKGRGAYEEGQKMWLLSMLVQRESDGIPLTREEKRLRDSYAQDLLDNPLPTGILRTPMNVFGQMSMQLPHIATAALGGGILGGGAAAAASTGPQGVAAPVTVPAGAIIGATTFATVESIRQTQIVERNMKYLSLVREGIDPGTARTVATAYGAVASLLEVGGAGALSFAAKPVLGAAKRTITKAMLGDAALATAKALGQPTKRQASVNFAKSFLTGYVGEAGTESAQEAAEIIASNIARSIEGKPTQSVGEMVDEWAESTVDILEGFVLIGMIPASASFVHDVNRIRQANMDAESFVKQNQALSNTKLSKRSDEHTAAFTDETMKGKRGRITFIRARDLVDAMEQSDVSRDELRATVPEVEAQLDAALASGGDVTLPTGQYHTKIVRTRLDPALRQHVRFEPNGYTVGEAQAIVGAAKDMASVAAKAVEDGATFAESAYAVEQQTLQQLNATGRVGPNEAAATATLFRAFMAERAAEDGVKPEEFLQELGGLDIARGEREQVAPEALQQETVTVRGNPDFQATPEEAELIKRISPLFGAENHLVNASQPLARALISGDQGAVQQARADLESSYREIIEDSDELQSLSDDLDELIDDYEPPSQPLLQTVSTRVPTAVRATENPSLEILSTDLDTAMADETALAKNAATMRDLPFLRVEEGATDEQVIEAFIQHAADNLNWLFDQMDPELRDRSAGWYDGGRRFVEAWSERYGISEQQAAAVMAILSPQRDWFINMTMAERLLDIWSSQDAWTEEMTTRARKRIGHIPLPEGVLLKDVLGKKLSELDGRAAAYWVRVFDQAHNDPALQALTPEGNDAGAWGVPVQWTSYERIAVAMSVLRDGSIENISQQLGGQHKVRSFYNNLFDPNAPQQDVTIDTHAVAAAYVLPLASRSKFVTQAWGGLGGATSRQTGLLGFYPYLAEAYRRVGQERNMLARQVQSITWEQGRALFTPARKRNVRLLQEADAIWARYRAGDIEAQEARELMVEAFGGFEPLTWEGTEASEGLAETYQGKSRSETKPKDAPAPDRPRIMVEAAPTTSPELLARWSKLSDEQRATATTEILSRVTRLVATEFGVQADLKQVRGAWMGEPEAAIAVTLDRPETSVATAAVLGDLLHQEAMFVISKTKAAGLEAAKGLSIQLPEGYTAEQIDQLYRDVLWPIEVNGKRPFVGHSTHGRTMLIGIDEKEFGIGVRELATLVAERLDDTFDVRTHDVFSRFLNRGEDYAREAAPTQRTATRRPPAETRSDRLVRETDAIYRETLDRVQRDVTGGVGQRGEGSREASRAWNARAGLPIEPDGTTVLRHWSRQPRAELDPSFHGTGIRGAERARKGEAEWVDRTYYGVEGYRKEAGLGAQRHEVVIDPGDLYDIAGDPNGLRKRAGGMTATQIEAEIKAAGFVGYFDPARPIVAVFDKQVPARITDEVTGETTEIEQPFQQEARGAFDVQGGKGIIALFDKADVTTVLHEMAHGFLHWYGLIAARGEGVFGPLPLSVENARRQMEAFLKWRGIEGGIAAWNAMSREEQRPHHEAWAEAFEVYAFEGKSPSLALQETFRSFRRWIVQLWRTLRGKTQQLDPEIRAIFDRMLASEDAIRHAQAVRGLEGAFKQKPASLTEEAWRAIVRASDAAFDAAVEYVDKRSQRNVQWLRNARGKKIREMQRKHDDVRAAVEAEERAKLEAEPVYRALKFLRQGKREGTVGLVDEEGQVVEFKNHKLETEAVREVWKLLPGTADFKKLRITSPNGLDPDLVGPWFGFESGDEMIMAIHEAAPDPEAAIQARTDRRMLAEHGDLQDAAEVQRAIDEALAGPAHAKALATELKAISGAVQPVQDMVRAARAVARNLLQDMPIAQIKMWRFQGAEARAGREYWRAVSKGDTEGAILAKREELLQHQMAREAKDIEREGQRFEVKAREFFRSDKKLAGRNRDIDLVRAGRHLLRAVQFKPPAEGQQAALEARSMEALQDGMQVVWSGLQGLVEVLGGKHYRSLPLGQFRSLADALAAAWKLSNTERLLQIADRKMALQEASNQLQLAIAAQQDRLAPGAQPPGDISPNLLVRGLGGVWHWMAGGKKFQHWAQFMDQKDPDGPFQELMMRPMWALLDAYRGHRNQVFERLDKKLVALMKQYGRRWDKKLYSSDLGYTFRGVRELIDVLLDIGNESNLAKRLISEGWTSTTKETLKDGLDRSQWDAFFSKNLQRMEKTEEFEANPDGVITPELMSFVADVWQEFENLRERAQQVHREIYGYEFGELELTEVELPWLDKPLKGGYAPLRVDWGRAKNLRSQIDVIESIAGLEHSFEYSRTAISAPEGFTKERNPFYFEKLSLDLGKRLQAIDEELRFIYLQPHVKAMARLTKEPGFRDAMNAYDRDAITGIIEPWLETTARQGVSRPGMHWMIDAIARWIKSATSIGILGLDLTVGLVQLTGVQLGNTQVERRFMRAGMRRVIRNIPAAWRDAGNRSERMAERLRDHTDKIRERLARVSKARFPRTWDAFRKESTRWAWLPIKYAQGLVDITIWHAAYEQSLAKSKENAGDRASMEEVERRAVMDADQAVERSQGSSLPESMAAFQVDTPVMQMFFQFMTFGNVLWNNVLVNVGLSPTVYGKIGNFLWLPFMISVYEFALRTPLEGLPDDEDDDGIWDDLAERFAESMARNTAGMVPMIGPTAGAAASTLISGDIREADRIASAPGIEFVKMGLRGFLSVLDDKEGADVRGIGTLFTLSGIPLRPIAETADYYLDVEAGRVNPTSDYDYIRGLLTGRASEGSR